jgi:hypothetical protein
MRVSVLACMQRHRGTRIQCACEPHSVPYIYELSWASQLHVCFLEPRIRHYQPLRERELRRSVTEASCCGWRETAGCGCETSPGPPVAAGAKNSQFCACGGAGCGFRVKIAHFVLSAAENPAICTHNVDPYDKHVCPDLWCAWGRVAPGVARRICCQNRQIVIDTLDAVVNGELPCADSGR